MSATVLLALLVVGLAVGFVSGLVGIGGGVLIVPFLYFFYAHPGWSGVQLPEGIAAAVSHATSLFIILPTAVQGTLRYHRAGKVSWRAALPMAAGAVVAAVLGARVALGLPPEALKAAFGALLVASALRLARGGAAGADQPLRLGLGVTLACGFLTGFLSALLGVGGGVIAIPLLIHVIGLEIDRVAATSLAVIVFAAASGTITYMMSGWGVTATPQGSLGFVHLLAGLPILAGAMLAVPGGVRANQRLDARRLRLLFALLFAVIGVDLLVRNALVPLL